MDMMAQYGVTPDAAKRIMRNCRMLINMTVDEFLDPDGIETGWRDWLADNDIEVSDDDCPSDFIRQMSDEYLFQRLISDNTFYGGMTSAIEACLCIKGLGIEVDG